MVKPVSKAMSKIEVSGRTGEEEGVTPKDEKVIDFNRQWAT